MDVLAKRLVWRVVRQRVVEMGSSAVLTSHSMEEAEALCDRVAVMADGRLRCLGAPAELRQRHGRGLVVRLALKREAAKAPALAFFKKDLGAADVAAHRGAVSGRVDLDKTASVVHAAVLGAAELLGVADYDVRPTTLDDVSFSFLLIYKSLILYIYIYIYSIYIYIKFLIKKIKPFLCQKQLS